MLLWQTVPVDSPAQNEPVLKICRELLAPLVEADGGAMYLVSASGDDIHIHLAGTCAGCPGSAMTRDGVLAPALRSLVPKVKLRLTTGFRVPDGAQRVEGQGSSGAAR